MKKTIRITLIPVALMITIFTTVVNAQVQNVGIGTALPDTNSILEVKSINKGLLLPRLADTSVVHTPVEGLFIYNKNTKTPFFHDGVRWQGLTREMSTTSAGADSVTYTLTGIGTAAELPASSFSVSGSAGGGAPTFSFFKKLDVNTIPFNQAMILGTTITTLEIKFYTHGASTPTVSVKLTNLSLEAFSYGVANGIEGGLSDEAYSIGPAVTGNFIYGFKDWVHGQSFAYNFGTHALTTY